MENLNLKKTFLYTLVASIAFSALLGIWAILSGEFGEFQAKILGTTLTVVGTSLLGLACGAFLESPRSAEKPLKTIPIAGIILAFVAAVNVLIMIWWQTDDVWKIAAVSAIFAFSLAQLSLLSLANLSARFEWVTMAAYLVILSLAAINSILIIVEPHSESNFVMRLIGVLAVIDASITVVIPILHRLSRADFAATRTKIEEIDAEIERLTNDLNNLKQLREKVLSEK
jgi:hypothetical protein